MAAMERLQILKRLFPRLRLRNRHNSSETCLDVPVHILPEPFVLPLTSWHGHFTPFSVQPKCLTDIDCTALLMGGAGPYEDFSSTCWLENHLHRFGRPSAFRSLSHCDISHHGSLTDVSFSDNDPSHDSQSTVSCETDGQIGQSSVENMGDIINLYRYSCFDSQFCFLQLPPPYSADAPPTYEEAMAEQQVASDNTGMLW